MIVTGYIRVEKVERLLADGAAGILSKPFALETLAAAVARAIERDFSVKENGSPNDISTQPRVADL